MHLKMLFDSIRVVSYPVNDLGLVISYYLNDREKHAVIDRQDMDFVYLEALGKDTSYVPRLTAQQAKEIAVWHELNSRGVETYEIASFNNYQLN